MWNSPALGSILKQHWNLFINAIFFPLILKCEIIIKHDSYFLYKRGVNNTNTATEHIHQPYHIYLCRKLNDDERQAKANSLPLGYRPRLTLTISRSKNWIMWWNSWIVPLTVDRRRKGLTPSPRKMYICISKNVHMYIEKKLNQM